MKHVADRARACAKGPKQAMLVEELLVGPIWLQRSQRAPQWMHVWLYGQAGLDGSSFQNLKKRLINEGFVFKKTNLIKEENRIMFEMGFDN